MLKANSPYVQPLLRKRDGGRGAERPRSRVPFRPEGQPRTAARSWATLSSCPSIGGRAPTRRARSATSRSPRWSRRSARPLQDRELQAGAGNHLGARPDYWGRKAAGEDRPREFRPAPLHLLPGRQRRPGRPSPRAATRTSIAENNSRDWAKYKFPALRCGRRDQGGVRNHRPASQCRVSSSTMRRPLFQDRRVRQALTLPSTSRA
jgi:hypothetical protein